VRHDAPYPAIAFPGLSSAGGMGDLAGKPPGKPHQIISYRCLYHRILNALLTYKNAQKQQSERTFEE
jgi:hypothetical protein